VIPDDIVQEINCAFMLGVWFLSVRNYRKWHCVYSCKCHLFSIFCDVV